MRVVVSLLGAEAEGLLGALHQIVLLQMCKCGMLFPISQESCFILNIKNNKSEANIIIEITHAVHDIAFLLLQASN